jgi:hypothetical protein
MKLHRIRRWFESQEPFWLVLEALGIGAVAGIIYLAWIMVAFNVIVN